KHKIKDILTSTAIGDELLFKYKKLTHRLPNPDMGFPELISLEIASTCNLSCIHCPPHMKEFKNEVRKFGLMEMDLFYKLMDEIDQYGKRRIALHKDGEPLLHPQTVEILERVKKNHDHIIYLTTNAHRLTEQISNSLLQNKINILNFSIGAASEDFYSKVRGKGFNKVIENISNLLKMSEESEWKPKVIVQIIDLPEYSEMENEIKNFKNYWSQFDVEVQIWKKLTWGVYDYQENGKRRYPCYSLWESFTVNSDGLVSACCMDWKQQLITGDTNTQTIKEIWKGDKLKHLRQMHIDGREDELPLCGTCNYWDWQERLDEYSI
ncbi:MAG: radical SAM protein, partial [Bacteroidota bacterium]